MNQTLAAFWTYERACSELEETNQLLEIWDGELIVSPTPSFLHQVVVSGLEAKLRQWVKRLSLGVVVTAPLDVVLEPGLVLQPDVIFISERRTAIIKQHVEGAPDLVMEVVSPDRRKRDYKEKKARYETHGISEYWIVDPEERHIEIWWLNQQGRYVLVGRFAGKEHAGSRLLPRFEVRAADVFSDPLKG
jgi:Uma2 family endonuclease